LYPLYFTHLITMQFYKKNEQNNNASKPQFKNLKIISEVRSKSVNTMVDLIRKFANLNTFII